jgi:predicted nucleic acid-binding Zn ribbon protein
MHTNDSALPIGSFLQQLARRSGIDKQLQAASVLDYWAEVIGEPAAKSCVIQKFEYGKLTVHCGASVWRAELQLRKIDIVARLNERAGADVVKEMILR